MKLLNLKSTQIVKTWQFVRWGFIDVSMGVGDGNDFNGNEDNLDMFDTMVFKIVFQLLSYLIFTIILGRQG